MWAWVWSLSEKRTYSPSWSVNVSCFDEYQVLPEKKWPLSMITYQLNAMWMRCNESTSHVSQKSSRWPEHLVNKQTGLPHHSYGWGTTFGWWVDCWYVWEGIYQLCEGRWDIYSPNWRMIYIVWSHRLFHTYKKEEGFIISIYSFHYFPTLVDLWPLIIF